MKVFRQELKVVYHFIVITYFGLMVISDLMVPSFGQKIGLLVFIYLVTKIRSTNPHSIVLTL